MRNNVFRENFSNEAFSAAATLDISIKILRQALNL